MTRHHDLLKVVTEAGLYITSMLVDSNCDLVLNTCARAGTDREALQRNLTTHFPDMRVQANTPRSGDATYTLRLPVKTEPPRTAEEPRRTFWSCARRMLASSTLVVTCVCALVVYRELEAS